MYNLNNRESNLIPDLVLNVLHDSVFCNKPRLKNLKVFERSSWCQPKLCHNSLYIHFQQKGEQQIAEPTIRTNQNPQDKPLYYCLQTDNVRCFKWQQ